MRYRSKNLEIKLLVTIYGSNIRIIEKFSDLFSIIELPHKNGRLDPGLALENDRFKKDNLIEQIHFLQSENKFRHQFF